MPTESGRSAAAVRNCKIECTLDNDPRLIAAVGTVVANAAQRAGLPEPAQEDVAAAAVETCREMFPRSGSKGSTPSAIKLIVTDFPDRVEVIFDASEKALLAARRAEAIRNPLEGLRVDRVQCETREGRVWLTLVKQCGETKSSKTA
jgi:hypothetical protein